MFILNLENNRLLASHVAQMIGDFGYVSAGFLSAFADGKLTFVHN